MVQRLSQYLKSISGLNFICPQAGFLTNLATGNIKLRVAMRTLMPNRRHTAFWLIVIWTVMLSGWTLGPVQAAMLDSCPQMAQQSMDAMSCCASHEHGAHQHDTHCQTLCAVSNATGPQSGAPALPLSHLLPASAIGIVYPIPLRLATTVVPSAPAPSASPPPSTRLLL